MKVNLYKHLYKFLEEDDYDDYVSDEDSDDSSWRVRRYAIFILDTLV